jgi:acetyl esterase/lipase
MSTRTLPLFRLAGRPGRPRTAADLRVHAEPAASARVLLDLPYGEDRRNKLDLYLPDARGFPVAVFVHGGSWCSGDKAQYGHLGAFLAGHGVGAAVVNYRLSPQARHPDHARDVAAAVAWAWDNVADFGGDRNRLSLFGHSAGAHLAALLATDESHLRPWGLTPGELRGVVAVSGVYHIHINVNLYGAGHVFRGADKRAASPLHHVKPGCPPFLILYAQQELFTLGSQARGLHARLKAARGRSQLVRVLGEGHSSIVHSLVVPGAAHGQQVVRFLRGG